MLLVLARIAQRSQRVGGLARLRHDDREPARPERRRAIAVFGSDIDLDRQMRKALEPVFGDHAGVIGGAAGGDRDAVEIAEIERQRHRQRHALGRHFDVIRQRMADDFGLLENFLGHEMAVIALVDVHHGGLRFQHRALHDRALRVVDLGAVAGDDHPVAVLEIAHRVGERRQRNGIGADEHRAFAVADGERRAFARADQKIVLAGEQERERKRAAQPRQRRLDRLDRRRAALHLLADQMRDDLGVGLGDEFGALGLQLAAQLDEILDDAVVHDRKPLGGVRMGVVLGRTAVGRPAGVADADGSQQRLAGEPRFQILQLALGAPPRQHAVLQRGDARGIIAAVFEALERIDQLRRSRLVADDSDNAAHAGRTVPLRVNR